MAGITVTPITGGAPAVAVAVDGSAAMTAVTLKRTADGVTVVAPIQPKTGVSVSTVQDYEIPWDTDVTYTATVTTAGGTTTYTSTTVQVSSTDAWAIHLAYPQRSVIIDQPNPVTGIFVLSKATATRAAQSTEHQVIGSPFPIIVTTGSRRSVRGSMVVNTTDAADEAALNLLLDDQTPILIRFPAAMDAGWEDGYYSIGDVTVDQPGTRGDPRRFFTLPFVRVTRPAVTTERAWDYPALTAAFADYAALTAAFADYGALTANERN